MRQERRERQVLQRMAGRLHDLVRHEREIHRLTTAMNSPRYSGGATSANTTSRNNSYREQESVSTSRTASLRRLSESQEDSLLGASRSLLNFDARVERQQRELEEYQRRNSRLGSRTNNRNSNDENSSLDTHMYSKCFYTFNPLHTTTRHDKIFMCLWLFFLLV